MVERQLLVLVFPSELPQVACDLPANGMGQACDILVAGSGQRVEQHASIGLGRVHTVHRENVKMNLQIQRRPKSLHDSQAAGLQLACPSRSGLCPSLENSATSRAKFCPGREHGHPATQARISLNLPRAAVMRSSRSASVKA